MYGVWTKKDLLAGLILFLTIFISLVDGTAVEAHSEIKEISPGMNEILDHSPERISVLFAEPVEVYSESIRLTNSIGSNVRIGKAVIDPTDKRLVTLPVETLLSDGRYTLEIFAIAMDGHEIKERFQFEIKKEQISELDYWRNLTLVQSAPADGEIVPTSPNKIELWFSDEIELEVFAIYDDNQSLAPIGETYVNPADASHYIIELDKKLSKGTYEINWYVRKDNKSKNGIFYFAVDEVTSITPPEGKRVSMGGWQHVGLIEFASWLSYLGVFILFGSMVFQLLISKGSENTNRWNKMKRIFFIMSVVGFLLLITIRKDEITNISVVEFIQFQFVWGMVLQLVLVLIAFFLRSMIGQVLMLAGTIMMWALSGHAVSDRYGGLISITLDALHLFSIAIWLGGLFALIVMIPKEEGLKWLKENGRKFSKYALISIFIMSLTGIGMLLRYLPSFTMDSLMISSWGQFLLFKVILFLVITFIGFYQMRLLKSGIDHNHTSLTAILGRTELIIGMSILFFAASMINTSPKAAEQGIYPTDLYSPVDVSVSLTPFQMGYNDLIIKFDQSEDIKNVDVELFMPPFMTRTITAFSLGEGTFQVTGGLLHGSGTTYLNIHVTKTSGENLMIPYEIQVPGDM